MLNLHELSSVYILNRRDQENRREFLEAHRMCITYYENMKDPLHIKLEKLFPWVSEFVQARNGIGWSIRAYDRQVMM